jgi:hypothetical protein
MRQADTNLPPPDAQASDDAPGLAKRTGVAGAARLGCVMCGVGNLVFALSPWFAGLLVARVLVGGGLGLALVLGPIFAREFGGVRLLGVFGAGVTLGMAAALGVGSVLEDAGVEWRVAFLVSAAAGVVAERDRLGGVDGLGRCLGDR